MITDKILTLENPLNLILDINDILLLNIDYKEEKKDNNIHRDVSYLIKKKDDSIFNKVVKNNCSDQSEDIFTFDRSEKYQELILDRNENLGDEGEEDLEQLIKNMQQSNKNIENKIVKLYKESFIKKSLIPDDNEKFKISNDDIKFINTIDELLGEFVNEKNKNLNL